MRTNIARISAGLALGLATAAIVVGHAHAQSSLGIGAAEPQIVPAGPLAGFLQWVNVEQQRFYHALTDAMRAMRENGNAFWILGGVSFAYGVFHAAGPGHGKAVISSYMVANEVELRRGILLSFVSAMLQGGTAILLMSAIFVFLRGTAITMTSATWTLEILSYTLVMLFGAWLLFRKVGALVAGRRRSGLAVAGGPAIDIPDEAAHVAHHHRDAHDHHQHHHKDHAHHHHDHSHGPGETCVECGHSHAPDPARLGGVEFDWRAAWSAIMAVGLRPCTGALIVLTFAFVNGLWAAGVASVLAMSVGTAITVSALATAAVLAKNLAVRLAGGGMVSGAIQSAFEIGGALLVFLFGLALLTASLQGMHLVF